MMQPRDARRPTLRILTQIYNTPWLITDEALGMICGIVERKDIDLDALAARLGRPLENAGGNSYVRDGVAVIDIAGPLVRYADLFSEISGATSVQSLSSDFQAAMDAPNVRQILLNINSPGGQVNGIQELADQIRAGAAVKKVTAYVDGQAASAGYWLAAAAPAVLASESSLIGSVGVVAAVTDRREAEQKAGIRRYEIVSSHAPFKRPDVATEEGRSQILETVNAIESLFIGRLAAFRNQSVEAVEQNFGQGKQFIARQAVGAGMADGIDSFEPLVARLAADRAPRAYSFSASQEEPPMADTPQQPQAAPAAQPPAQPQPPVAQPAAAAPPTPAPAAPAVDAVATERTRIAAILNAPEAVGRETLARTLALETTQDAETARKILASAPAAQPAAAPPANALAAEMAKLKNPAVGPSPGDADTAASEAARVLAFIPKAQRYQAS
jgi:signal peptide peptidase SppA